MESTTGNPFTNSTLTTESAPTKSKEQILIQSSGAMIAVIVIGIIIILTILLIILKTYHRSANVSDRIPQEFLNYICDGWNGCTQASRLLGRGPKSRTKSSSTAHTNLTLGQRVASSVSGSAANSRSTVRNGFHLPRVPSPNQNSSEQLSTISDSTVVTIHSAPPENT